MDFVNIDYAVTGAEEGLFEPGKCCVLTRKAQKGWFYGSGTPLFGPCSKPSMQDENIEMCSVCYHEMIENDAQFISMRCAGTCPTPDGLVLRAVDAREFCKGMIACDEYGKYMGYGLTIAVAEIADYPHDSDDEDESVILPSDSDDEDESVVLPSDSEEEDEDDEVDSVVIPSDSEKYDDDDDDDDDDVEDEAMAASPERMQEQINSLQQQVTVLQELIYSALNATSS